MPSPEKSYPYLVADRFASFLAADGHGVYGDDLPENSEWVFVLGPQAPSSDVTCINVTPSNPAILRADVQLGVQLKWRGAQDADPWGEVADRVQAVADWAQPGGHPRSSFALGDLRFGRVNVTSTLVLGPDTQRRPIATLNLEFHARRVVRPSAAPPRFAITVPVNNSTVPSPNGGRIQFAGTGVPGARVVIRSGAGTDILDTRVLGDGTWSGSGQVGIRTATLFGTHTPVAGADSTTQVRVTVIAGSGSPTLPGPDENGYYEIPGATFNADGYATFGGS